MVATPFLYAVNGSTIEDVCDNVRIFPERMAGLRGQSLVLPFEDGELDVLHRRFGSFDLVLETLVKFSPDFYTNKEVLTKLLLDTSQAVFLQRDLPSGDDVEIPIRIFNFIAYTEPRNRLLWLCRTMDPFWRDRAIRLAQALPVTVGGDAPVGDAVFHFTAGTDIRMTHTGSGDWVEIDGAATGVSMDVGAKSVQLAAADHDAKFEAKEPHWIRLQPGVNAFTFTGGGAANVDLHDKRR